MRLRVLVDRVSRHVWLSGLRLLLVVAVASSVIVSGGVSDAAERDYEVASVDIYGNRATNSDFGSYLSNLTPLKPYSVAAGGTKVVFAKRQGPFPHDAAYVPMAPREWCGINGGCYDIFVHDRASKKNVSVLGHLTVANRRPRSSSNSFFAGTWASSEDANSFLVTWNCQGGWGEPPEVIGGTAICSSGDPTDGDREALVLIDLDSATNTVLAVAGSTGGDGFYDADLSANGDRAVFGRDPGDEALPGSVKCFRPNWDCQIHPAQPTTVLWDRATGTLQQIAVGSSGLGVIYSGGTESGDFSVQQARLSGDGKKVFFSVTSRDWDDLSGPEAKHLFIYDVAKGSYSEIDLPWEEYGCDHRDITSCGFGHWSLVGSSYNGSIAYMVSPLVDVSDRRLVQIDVSAATVRVFDDIVCGRGTSVSFDGRYVGCNRSDTSRDGVRLPPAVVDTTTGAVYDTVQFPDEFAPTNGEDGPYLSSDGAVAVVLEHKTPEDDDGKFGFDYALQLYVTDAIPTGGPGPGPGGSGTFSDDDTSVFEADIEWMAAEGVTKGCNPPVNDRFCPDGVVTRGQMAAFLVRALGLSDRLTNPFTDDDESIFEADIERLAAAGITRGCNPPTNDRFCPDGKVTREVMAAFLVRALGYTDNGGGDLFTDDDESLFEADIDRLGTAGVTRGCNPPANTRFCPKGNVTRGQMAAFLHRALG